VEKAFGAKTSDVRKLARFIAQEHDGRMTREELTSWLKMIPDGGTELASNRLAYRKAVKDALLESNIGQRFDKVKQAERKYASAIGDAKKLSDDFNAVSSDPLVQFFSNTAFKLDTKDYANNARLVERIVSEVDPSVVKDFVSKANSSGRSDLVSQMGDVAASNAVRRFIPSQYQDKPMLKLKEITNLFLGQGDDIQRERESLKALIGNDRFNEIVKVVVEPIDRIARQRESLQTVRGQTSNAFNDLRAISTIYGGAMGTMTSGMIAAQGGRSVIKALDSRMYNLVSQVYLNPKLSKNLQAVGYDLTKFAQMSPVYAAAVTAAMQADASQNPPNQ
jgi:methyl-accepting chemotaxis protein